MRHLTFFDVEPIDQLAHPTNDESISIDSCALEVFTDFDVVSPLVIHPYVSAIEAEKMMLKTHVRLKIVVDEDDNFIGIVTLDQLNSQEVMKRIAHGIPHEELYVNDFTLTKNELKAFDYHQLAHASINDVIEALKGSGHQHCLVIDHQQHEIRGIISASDVARKLKLPLNIAHQSNFLGIFEAMYH